MKSLWQECARLALQTRRTPAWQNRESVGGGKSDCKDRLGPGCWGLRYQMKGLQLCP